MICLVVWLSYATRVAGGQGEKGDSSVLQLCVVHCWCSGVCAHTQEIDQARERKDKPED